jgi:perosamine synthetase
MQIPLSKPDIGKGDERAIMKTIQKCIRTGRLSRGPTVTAFEKQFSSYLGVKHSLAISNGTAALHLALLAHGIGQGDAVLTTPFTFVSTSNVALYVGARPRFVDIDPTTYNIDPAKLQEAIDPKTKALIVVHVFGLPCDMKPIMDICQDHHITLIEDACEALGATYKGRKVGSFSTSCFSFYPNKVVTTAEGGMLCTDDHRIMAIVDSLRNQGRKSGEWLEHQYVGFNYRMSDVHAAFGIPLMRKVDRLNAIREKNARLYTIALKNYTQIKTPPDVEGRTWFVYVVEVNDRDRVASELNKAGIESKPYFPPVHLQTPYRQMGFREGDFPVCENISRKVLALPFFTSITPKQIDEVTKSLGELSRR